MNPTVASAAVAGGVQFTVRYKPGGRNAEETVVVRSVPWSKMDDYLRLQDREAELAELLCERPRGWGDTLEIDSLCDLIEKGAEINDPNFFKLVERRKRRIASMGEQLKASEGVLPSGSPK